MAADQDVLRILDVNVNRAREGLRVVEDYARFVLDDQDAALAAKTCRHRVRQIAEGIGVAALSGARDILGDVGRDTKLPTELARADPEAVVHAAFARLGEAARSLGEFGKLVSAAAAADAEGLRYGIYELQQRVALRGDRRRRFRSIRLYVLITAGLCRGDWLQVSAAAIRGGAGCLQLREKGLQGSELLARARALRELTTEQGVLLAINDRPDIARLVGADIVHVGQGDLSVHDARRIAGAGLLVGKSTHTDAQFAAAAAELPDYLAVGPMYASVTKPQDHIAGPETLARMRPSSRLSLVAIGGITADNVRAVMAAGADSVAVCQTVIGASDPEAAARALCDRMPPTVEAP